MGFTHYRNDELARFLVAEPENKAAIAELVQRVVSGRVLLRHQPDCFRGKNANR